MLLLECLLNVGNVVLDGGVCGIELRGLLVRVEGTAEVTLSVQGGALAAPALGPVWFELGGLVGIFQGIFVVSLGGVRSRAVAVQDVVVGGQSDSLRELFTAVTGQSVLHVPTRSSKHKTHTASSKFLAAMALLPRAFSSSAVDILASSVRSET